MLAKTRSKLAFFCALMTMVVGVMMATPAHANPAGNYAQPWTWFSCGGMAIEVQGNLAIHYNHGSDHSDDPYGTYWNITFMNSNTTGAFEIDTDVRYSGQTTWHFVGSQFGNGQTQPTGGDLFDYDAARTANGGYVRWAMQWVMDDGSIGNCTIAPHGWSTGEQYGAP